MQCFFSNVMRNKYDCKKRIKLYEFMRELSKLRKIASYEISDATITLCEWKNTVEITGSRTF